MNEILRITSTIPRIAKKYLKVILESQNELIEFITDYYPQHQNVMLSVAEYRAKKMEERTLTYSQFLLLYRENELKGLSKLFLYPINEQLFKRYLILPIEEGQFTLKQVYEKQQKNPLLNPILVAKYIRMEN